MQTLRPKLGTTSKSLTSVGNAYSVGCAVPRFRTKPPAQQSAVLIKIFFPVLMCAALWSHVWLGTLGAVALASGLFLVLSGFGTLSNSLTIKSKILIEIAFGERVWLNRLSYPTPSDISKQITVLYLAQSAGFVTALAGGYFGSMLMSSTGLLICSCAQFVYFGKVRNLYLTMKDQVPLYRLWTAVPGNDNSP